MAESIINKLHNEPESLRYRPLNSNQTSNWTYTVPASGILYLCFLGTTRSYCGVTWNGAQIGDICMPTSTNNALAVTFPVIVKEGDTIGVTGLTANCYLSSTRTGLLTWE